MEHNNIIDISEARKAYIHKNNKDNEKPISKPIDVIEHEIGSEPITPEQLMEEVEEAFVMGKQEAIYQSVTAFLATPEAIKYNIIGVEIIIENGYANCYWKFGERGVHNNGE